MPNIRTSDDLITGYDEISEFCSETHEPVFITKDGRGDLAVMSMEEYDRLESRFELYSKIAEGLEDVREGRTEDAYEALERIKKRVGLV